MAFSVAKRKSTYTTLKFLALQAAPYIYIYIYVCIYIYIHDISWQLKAVKNYTTKKKNTATIKLNNSAPTGQIFMKFDT
jgi:hypothetical protein